MQTNESLVPAQVAKKVISGQASGIAVAAGQKLVIETSPGGDEIFEGTVPGGKQWVATVWVTIEETDT